MADSQVFLGIVLELGDKEIALEPQTAITEVKTQGIEVALPPKQTIPLGSVGDNLKSVLDSLNVNSDFLVIKEDDSGNRVAEVRDLPDIEALQNSVNLLFNAQLAVEQFHVKVPPTHRADGTTVIPPAERGETRYTLGLSAIWPGDTGTLVGSLKLKGLFFKASNEGG